MNYRWIYIYFIELNNNVDNETHQMFDSGSKWPQPYQLFATNLFLCHPLRLWIGFRFVLPRMHMYCLYVLRAVNGGIYGFDVLD